MPDRRRRFHRSAMLALAALVGLSMLLLSACGASTDQNAASTEQARERRDEVKMADFARCLREHGIRAETVSGPSGGHGLKVGGPGSGPQKMEAAQKACARYRPEPKKVDLSPQQKVETEEHLQKFAKCMREHGIKVEVSTQEGAVQIGIHSHPGSGEPNPESPAFQRAQAACQSLMPKPPGGGGALKGASKAGPEAGGRGASLSITGG